MATYNFNFTPAKDLPPPPPMMWAHAMHQPYPDPTAPPTLSKVELLSLGTLVSVPPTNPHNFPIQIVWGKPMSQSDGFMARHPKRPFFMYKRSIPKRGGSILAGWEPPEEYLLTGTGYNSLNAHYGSKPAPWVNGKQRDTTGSVPETQIAGPSRSFTAEQALDTANLSFLDPWNSAGEVVSDGMMFELNSNTSPSSSSTSSPPTAPPDPCASSVDVAQMYDQSQASTSEYSMITPQSPVAGPSNYGEQGLFFSDYFFDIDKYYADAEHMEGLPKDSTF